MEEKEVEKVRKETKELLDGFSKALANVDLKWREEWNVERDGDRRIEKEGKETERKTCDETFRAIMFENAPAKSEDFIIAEKKSW